METLNRAIIVATLQIFLILNTRIRKHVCQICAIYTLKFEIGDEMRCSTVAKALAKSRFSSVDFHQQRTITTLAAAALFFATFARPSYLSRQGS